MADHLNQMQRTRHTYISDLDGQEDYYLLIHPRLTTGPHAGDVIVYLHGHGGTPEQLGSHRAMRGLLRRATSLGFTFAAPMLRGNAWMNDEAEADLAQFTRMIRDELQPRRIVLTGASMGATGTMITATRQPTLFDGYVAFGGAYDLTAYHTYCSNSGGLGIIRQIARTMEHRLGGRPEAAGQAYRERSPVLHAAAITRPTRIVHGTADKIVPITSARALAASLPAQSTVELVEVADGTHDSILAAEAFIGHVRDVLRRIA